MSLFQCQRCGCRENTALAYQGCDGYAVRFFDWTGIEDRKGLKLCSACGPTLYANGKPTDLGKWHGQFRRAFYPLGLMKTNPKGSLEHVATGESSDEELRKYECEPPTLAV